MKNNEPCQFATGLMLARTRSADAVTPGLVRRDCISESLGLAEAGFAGAELPSPFVEALRGQVGVDAGYWKGIAQVFADAGLAYLTVHGPNLPTLDTPLPDAIDRAVWHAEVARDLGAASIVVHPTSHSHPHLCSVVPRLLERDTAVALAVAQALEGSQTRLAMENLPTYGVAYLIGLMQHVTHPCVGVCFDTGHWNVRPERSLDEVLALLGPRIVHLHLSDNDGMCDAHQPPGVGSFDWAAFLGALPESVFSQPWLIELDPPDPAAADDFDEAWARLADVRLAAIQTARKTFSQAAEAISARNTAAPPVSRDLL